MIFRLKERGPSKYRPHFRSKEIYSLSSPLSFPDKHLVRSKLKEEYIVLRMDCTSGPTFDRAGLSNSFNLMTSTRPKFTLINSFIIELNLKIILKNVRMKYREMVSMVVDQKLAFLGFGTTGLCLIHMWTIGSDELD